MRERVPHEVGTPSARLVARKRTFDRRFCPAAVLQHGVVITRASWKIRAVGSPQALSEAERRIVAGWAADCAERVLRFVEAEAPEDRRTRDAIARARAFARGKLDVAEEIRRRFVAGGAAQGLSPHAAAAARAAMQAAAVPHMGAHALGAAAYAAKAVALAAPDRPSAVTAEIRWQLRRMSADVKAALRKLPPVGKNSSGPLGPGLLASGLLGVVIGEIQLSLKSPKHALPAVWPIDGRRPTRSLRSPGSKTGPSRPLRATRASRGTRRRAARRR